MLAAVLVDKLAAAHQEAQVVAEMAAALIKLAQQERRILVAVVVVQVIAILGEPQAVTEVKAWSSFPLLTANQSQRRPEAQP